MLDNIHSDIVRTSPILFQELHALAFTSGSIRRIDLTNVLGSLPGSSAASRFETPSPANPKAETEVARAILLLLRTQNIPLESLYLGGNPLTTAEVDELGASTLSALVQRHS